MKSFLKSTGVLLASTLTLLGTSLFSQVLAQSENRTRIGVEVEHRFANPDGRNYTRYGTSLDLLNQYGTPLSTGLDHIDYANGEEVIRVSTETDLTAASGPLSEIQGPLPTLRLGLATNDGDRFVELGLSQVLVDERESRLLIHLDHTLNTRDERAVAEQITSNTIELVYSNPSTQERFSLSAEANSDGVTLYEGLLSVPFEHADFMTLKGYMRAASAQSDSYWTPNGAGYYALGVQFGIPIELSENARCLVGVTPGMSYEPSDGDLGFVIPAGASCTLESSPTADNDWALTGSLTGNYGVTAKVGFSRDF